MPVQNDLGIGKRFVQFRRRGTAQLIAVRHDDAETIQLDLSHLGELRADLEIIDVAMHGCHGSQGLQPDHHIPIAHVPGVEDVIHPLENLQNLHPQESMCVGNDAESH